MQAQERIRTARATAFFLGMVLLLASAAGAAESRWPSRGGDYGRSGQGQDQGPTAGAIEWKFETGSAVVNSVTIGSEGQIHVACEGGVLYTLGLDGRLAWSLDVNAPLLSAPSIGPDGSLFVGSRDGRLYAVAADGRLRWTHNTGGAIYCSPAVSPTGDVYVGSADGALYALGKDGTELWRFRTKGQAGLAAGAVFASPTLAADGTVYVAGVYDPNLYALNPGDGSTKWVCGLADPNTPDPNSQGSGTGCVASPVIGKDGTIYQTLLYDSHLYAIEPGSGKVLWSTDLLETSSIDARLKDLDADGWSEPVVGPDGTLYVGLDDGTLRAVDPGGLIRWAVRLGDVDVVTLTVDKSGLVYAACDDGIVRVIGPGGTEVHRIQTGGWPACPVVAAGDTLVVTDSQDYSVLIAGAKNAVWVISSPKAALPER